MRKIKLGLFIILCISIIMPVSAQSLDSAICSEQVYVRLKDVINGVNGTLTKNYCQF